MSNQSNLAELYTALFNRAPDASGLAYWEGELASGKSSLLDIARNWVNSQSETASKYPDTLSDGDFINAIYNNVLARAADAGGLAYWGAELQDGTLTRDEFLLAILNGAKGNTSAQGLLDAALVQNKAQAGLAFAETGLNDTALAAKVLAPVTADSNTLNSTMSLLKLVPKNASGQTQELLDQFSSTLDKVAELSKSATPETAQKLAAYLATIANTFGTNSSLSSLFNSISDISTKALADASALNNPESLGGTAVVVATPGTGGPAATFTVSQGLDGALEFAGTATGSIKLSVDGLDVVAERGGVKATLLAGTSVTDVKLPTGAELILAAGTNVTQSAANASNHVISGDGFVNITGSAGVQTLNVFSGIVENNFLFSLPKGNIIEAGAGADVINLGVAHQVTDVIKIGLPDSGLYADVRKEQSDADMAGAVLPDLSKSALDQMADLQASKGQLVELIEHRSVLQANYDGAPNKALALQAAFIAFSNANNAWNADKADNDLALAQFAAYEALAALHPSFKTTAQSGYETTQQISDHGSEIAALAINAQMTIVNDSLIALNADIAAHGTTTELNSNVIKVDALLSLAAAQSSLVAGGASDSTAAAFDVITGFQLGTDRLEFSSFVGTKGTGTFGDFTVTNGIATANTGALTVEHILASLGTSQQVVAFVNGNDTFVVKGDGIAGVNDTDAVVKLVGVKANQIWDVIWDLA
ncbi:hypothetical protein PS918_02949 [Pseudomonas fluorescens]|uniref:DUF4214 domain-containing protein n=2 Tax=Pseudomonas fluorescens TaxID=294 RepID=A0A5E7SNP0_PSEFL|nr:DUF4214 domain-containing protein [Pseudomonas fluorescens]VVP88076.1 hypothetical protein PS918_02949 [Pseudomonas fluorescens]